jgi:hypothetical protein
MALEIKSIDGLVGTPISYAYAVKAGPWQAVTKPPANCREVSIWRMQGSEGGGRDKRMLQPPARARRVTPSNSGEAASETASEERPATRPEVRIRPPFFRRLVHRPVDSTVSKPKPGL